MPDNTTSCLSQHLASERAADSLLPLKVSGLVWSAGGKRIVNGINLTLSDGGITAIMGPNGAGKSVLIRLLHGLLEPDAGHHWLERKACRRCQPRAPGHGVSETRPAAPVGGCKYRFRAEAHRQG
jgi:ABC-type transport system involved in cytochrome bd biosynthesis fused ATPase/permease subunit